VSVPSPKRVLLYDGVCGLCNRLVAFVIRRDPEGRLRFAALQSPYGRAALGRHGHSPDDLDTAVLLLDAGTPEERCLVRARAILTAVGLLGGIWRVVSWMRVIPAPLLDLGYRLVARTRYRFFGRAETCVVPDPTLADRFLDEAA
jgi:predicted DCC family thiol-disulfide oxidoreductase YuxK